MNYKCYSVSDFAPGDLVFWGSHPLIKNGPEFIISNTIVRERNLQLRKIA